jgi:hypothetical protein
MNKLFKKWSLLIPVTALCLIGAMSLSSEKALSNSSTVTDDSKNIAYASVWDRETEPNYSGTLNMTVYRSPSCGCCGVWVEHAQKHGFKIKDIKTNEMEALKQKYNVPPELASCHTTIIDGYVMEGHIPADDIKRFLKEKPQSVGLTVPGMPLGTPGMEAGNKKQPFQVLAFGNKGEIEVFKEYQSY